MNLMAVNEYSIVRWVTVFAVVAFCSNTFAAKRGSSHVSKRGKPYALSSNSYQQSLIEKRQNLIPNESEKRHWEFRTAPVALFVKWYTLDVSYRLSEHWSTGPAVILFNASEPAGMLGPNYNGYALGWNGNYYFDSVYKRSWYISAHGYYESYKSYLHGYHGYKEMVGYKINSALGYQWKRSRINFMAGFGAELRNQNITDKIGYVKTLEQQNQDSSEAVWFPHIEFKMGIEI